MLKEQATAEAYRAQPDTLASHVDPARADWPEPKVL